MPSWESSAALHFLAFRHRNAVHKHGQANPEGGRDVGEPVGRRYARTALPLGYYLLRAPTFGSRRRGETSGELRAGEAGGLARLADVGSEGGSSSFGEGHEGGIAARATICT